MEEFFLPFCPRNHDILNHKFNLREKYENKGILYAIGRAILKFKNGADYLTDDIFGKACLEIYSKEVTYVRWDELGINGEINLEFGKLREIALRYNRKTFLNIKKRIKSIGLPKKYYSIQFRAGDKLSEVKKNMDVDCVLKRLEESKIKIDNLFIFTDNYYYVEAIKEKCPDWGIYTLTRESERGYSNNRFNKLSQAEKRNEIIKLLAMVEICLYSEIHFGCEVTNVNNYIKNIKDPESYISIWTKEDAQVRDELIDDFKKYY